jgi:hypothetical protein
MDPASACRLAIKVPAYVEQKPDGFGDYHVTENWMRAVDKDTFNWMGFHALLDEEIVHGQDQELQVTYLDKNTNETTRINSDSSLLHAFDMYWDKRKLPVTVEVVDTRAWDTMGKQFPDSVVDDPPQPLDVIMPADNAHNPDTDATPEDANPGIDSTVLTGRWKGQLAAAVGIDGNNWMLPVSYGVFGSETKENWEWYMKMLHKAIGSPPGLVLSTDAGIYSCISV